MFTNTLTQNEDPENDLSNARNKRSKKNTQEMTTFEKQFVEIWNSTNNLAFDEDVAFFNSILPAVRRLDFEKKIFFSESGSTITRWDKPRYIVYRFSPVPVYKYGAIYKHWSNYKRGPIYERWSSNI